MSIQTPSSSPEFIGSAEGDLLTKSGTYYLLLDASGIARRLLSTTVGMPEVGANTEILARTVSYYEAALRRAFQDCFPHLKTFTLDEVDCRLTETIRRMLQRYPDDAVVCLDRYLLASCEDIPVFRIEVNRMEDGSKIERPGAPSVEEQLQRVVAGTRGRRVILVDDGAFSGGTLAYVVEELRRVGKEPRMLVVFLGNPDLRSIGGVPLYAFEELRDCIDWVDSRDLGILGGRLQKRSRTGRSATALPYIAPFSDGRNASIPSRQLSKISTQLLTAERTFLNDLETIVGRPLAIKDAIQGGYPLPELPFDAPVGLHTGLQTLNARARNLLRIGSMPKPDRIIFDNDGTLYRLDGPGERFAGSTLERKIMMNAVSFVQAREGCLEEDARRIVAEGLRDSVGLSRFLAQRYGIKRADYFDVVWGAIDPADVIRDRSMAQKVLSQLRERGIALDLLTGGGRLWTERTLNFLGVHSLFDSVVTAEQFEQKSAVFADYAVQYREQCLLSIGDDDGDTLPASACGMQALKVSPSFPFSYLLALPW